MTSVEQEIWNIFTFYTLHGNPLDPEHIRCTQFVKLCRDCQIVGSSLSEADPPLTDADVQVSYTAEVKRQDRTGTLQKMNYNDFLTVLMKLAIKVYPRSKTVDDAFQRLLMDNVLPLASRRCPDNVDMFLENGDVQRLYCYYSDALEQIFSFYATSDKRTSRALLSHAISTGTVSSAFAATSALTLSGKSPARATRTVNTMKEALGYAEFLKFATDFDLSSSVILSTLEIGDIYLSSIKAVEPDSTIRKLTFPEFWEALVRCALVAYSKISDATIIDKIRGLFLYMWRAINRSVPRAFSERRNVSTYAGDLLSGAMLFNKRFTAQWTADGYRDYLGPESVPLESGKAVLSRLLRPKEGGAGSGGAMLLHPGGAPALTMGGGAGSVAGSPTSALSASLTTPSSTTGAAASSSSSSSAAAGGAGASSSSGGADSLPPPPPPPSFRTAGASRIDGGAASGPTGTGIGAGGYGIDPRVGASASGGYNPYASAASASTIYDSYLPVAAQQPPTAQPQSGYYGLPAGSASGSGSYGPPPSTPAPPPPQPKLPSSAIYGLPTGTGSGSTGVGGGIGGASAYDYYAYQAQQAAAAAAGGSGLGGGYGGGYGGGVSEFGY